MERMALAALIDDTIHRNGWNDRDVVRRAADREHKLNPQEITNYRQSGMKHLSPAKIKALAAGLGVPAFAVALAALRDHGIDMPVEIRDPEGAVQADYTLSEATKRHVLLLIKEDRSDAPDS